ncbi:hypothetical protein [Parathermosynechococcus lividus]
MIGALLHHPRCLGGGTHIREHLVKLLLNGTAITGKPLAGCLHRLDKGTSLDNRIGHVEVLAQSHQQIAHLPR